MNDAGTNVSVNEQWTDVRTLQVVEHDDVVHVIGARNDQRQRSRPESGGKCARG